ncbi:hypothetical protein ABTX81_30600 [Kitasatospora sp. NPDC097605]|uniref:hypothetical protein n=1 Tax=Kitasatospora sp. NPDC097605 TaxID=3157226 RepID=UPI0033309D45
MSSFGDPDQHHLVITSEGLHGTVHLDGEDISKQIRGYGLRGFAGEPVQAVLYLAEGRGTTAFDGLARVVVADEQPNTADLVAEFLGGIDADLLAAAVLKRDDLDGKANELTRAALRQLTEWARGDG